MRVRRWIGVIGFAWGLLYSRCFAFGLLFDDGLDFAAPNSHNHNHNHDNSHSHTSRTRT